MAPVEQKDPALAAAEETRKRLLVQLGGQRQHLLEMLKWYTGEQDLPGVWVRGGGPLYKRLRESSRNTWARLIIDAIAERLEVHGYRSVVAGADAEAWRILQGNQIDADQHQVHTEALICGRSYVMVIADPAGGEMPLITPETALEVTHETKPGNRRITSASLKAFPTGDRNEWRVELYTPEETFAWHTTVSNEKQLPWAKSEIDALRFSDPERATQALGVVRVVPFENRPLAALGALSEITDLVSVLQRIDELTYDRQIAAHFAAFRQRWATGLAVPRDPETGLPVEPFKAAVEKLWISEDEATRFGSFEATALDGYIKAIDSEVAELAAISRVPAHYLMSQNLANPPSAESLVAGESGLVKKVQKRQSGFGESWEQVVRLAFKIKGNTDAAEDTSSEMLWRDPQVRHPAQVADAAVKYDTLGVPREALWAMIGATPQEIELWKILAAEQTLGTSEEVGLMAQRLGLAVKYGIVSQDEARAELEKQGAELSGTPPPLPGSG